MLWPWRVKYSKAIRAAGGLSGIHVCGNSDWNVIIKTSVDILNFDAYAFGRLSLYSKDVTGYLSGAVRLPGALSTTPEELSARRAHRWWNGSGQASLLTARGLAESWSGAFHPDADPAAAAA